MKLAEALITRGDLQNRLNELRTRLNNNAVYQEGEKPTEDPNELLQEIDSVIKELENLIGKINLTNASLKSEGITMTELLSRRDTLRLKIETYREFLSFAGATGRRARGSEIKLLASVNVADFQKLTDKESSQLRKLEIKIQELNWTNDLLD